MTEEMQDVDVAIVGGGGAGLGAALMLGRSRRSVLVVDDGRPRNAPATGIHGYLSRDGIAPTEFLSVGRREVQGYGVRVASGRVTSAARRGTGFMLELADGGHVGARRLLVATGLTDQLPGVPGLAERWGRDVLHCPYCHGWEVRDRALVVLGTGPMSGHQAQLFRQLTDRVTLLRHDAPPPNPTEAEALRARGIDVIEARAVGLAVTDDVLTGVITDAGETIACDAVALGARVVPNSAVLSSLGIEPVAHPSGMGEMIMSDERGQTDVTGVYVAGNVADPTAQVSSAAARGSFVGAMINMDLITEEIAAAVDDQRSREASSR